MITQESRVYIALPAMDELDYLPEFFRCLEAQTFGNFKLMVCVNQPEEWWNLPDKVKICVNNQQSIQWLESKKNIDIQILDRSTKGKGWTGKKSGVGWARRLLMDAIIKEAGSDDLIISLDADTSYGPAYVQSVVDAFIQTGKAVALSVPYYHLLTGDEAKDRAILRYEIFMRYYAINLWRIKSPYSFTAIGSAIALPVKSYKAIGGITPHKSGEDFYFLQKLRKYGRVMTSNTEKVYPAARYSDRVGFGTGPAMIKGRQGQWESYPIFPFDYFDEIKRVYDLFPELYIADMKTHIDAFLREKFGEKSIWQPLRENAKTERQFIRSCYHKLDAFRVLQYLKWRENSNNQSDEGNLLNWLQSFYQDEYNALFNNGLSFAESSIDELNHIRDLLVKIEENYQSEQNGPEI